MSDSEENPSRQKFSIDEDVAGYPLEKFTGQGEQSREELERMHEQAGRVPPQASDVERSVLGAMLIEREAIPSAVEVLPSNAFYDERHQEIYDAIVQLFERDNPVDLVTVTEELKRRDALEDVGGGYYLSKLTSEVASAANVEYHARIIAEKSILRKMIETLTRLVGQAYEPGADAFDMLDQAEQQIFQLSESQLRRSSSDIGSVLKDTMERLEQIDNQDEAVTGVPSGYPELDRKTSGWQDSDLIIVAARPSMGKTALALNFARNAARHPRKPTPVAIFSLEMSAGQLAQRLLTSEARVDAQAARTGRLKEDDWPRLARAAGVLNDLDIYIDDTPALTVLELRAKCRRLKAEHDIGLIVVDYLQLMHGSGDANNREQEIAKISRSLKSLAKELETPVIALSQLNRGVENRGGDKRPQLSDLRESGCLTGDTRIPLADTGERVRMEELQGRDDFEVWALNPETHKIEARSVSNCFSTGVKDVYRLTTRSGRTIRASANHKFKTIDGWKRLDELEEDEHLALPRRLPTQRTSTLSDDQLKLLGHLIGDGCTLPRHSIQYTTNEKELAKMVERAAIAAFGDRLTPRLKQQRSWYQLFLTSSRKLTNGVRNPLAEWLDELEIFGLRGPEKKIPESVCTEDASGIGTFLRHLWATDGCIKLGGGKKPYPAIYFASSSPFLAQGVQSLLLRLGIGAGLRRVPQKNSDYDQYHVIVSGQPAILRFADVVGAVGTRRKMELERIKEFFREKGSNPNRDVIPGKVWEIHVKPALTASGQTHRDLYAQLGMSYGGTAIFKRSLSRARCEKVADIVDSDELRHIARSDIFWDRVQSIEHDGRAQVYDITVPGHHNFVANDIVVHNSIEQDADVVMFIYRPERYDITVDEHGNSTEGMAEIIIGKQRNGPVGTVDLSFVKQYARFESLSYRSDGSGGPGPGGGPQGGDGAGGHAQGAGAGGGQQGGSGGEAPF